MDKHIISLDGNIDFQGIKHKHLECVPILIEKNLTIATMESCTSGLIATMITDVEGASSIFKLGYVTYSNEAKVKQGVPKEVIDTYGVYSSETAYEMANACRKAYNTNIGIGVTGTTGRVDPANKDSEKGIIYFCIMYNDNDFNFKITMDTDELTRREMKERVAYIVFDKLFSIVTK